VATPPWTSRPVTDSITRVKYPVMYVACSRRFFPMVWFNSYPSDCFCIQAIGREHI